MTEFLVEVSLNKTYNFSHLGICNICFCYSDPYGDPYYDIEMDAFWRGGQYENFRVQYTETPLPYYPVSTY